MLTLKRLLVVSLLAAGPACAGDPVGPTGSVGECRNCGTVQSIDRVEKSGQASGAGAVIGAVIGGVVGHQFGSGRGQDAATAAGAAGGAIAGHQTEKNMRSGAFFRVTVRMDSGERREVNVAETAGLHAGDRVRITGNNLEIVRG